MTKNTDSGHQNWQQWNTFIIEGATEKVYKLYSLRALSGKCSCNLLFPTKTKCFWNFIIIQKFNVIVVSSFFIYVCPFRAALCRFLTQIKNMRAVGWTSTKSDLSSTAKCDQHHSNHRYEFGTDMLLYYAKLYHTTLPCHFVMPLCHATLPCHFAMPLCNATLHCHFAIPLWHATLPLVSFSLTVSEQ